MRIPISSRNKETETITADVKISRIYSKYKEIEYLVLGRNLAITLSDNKIIYMITPRLFDQLWSDWKGGEILPPVSKASVPVITMSDFRLQIYTRNDVC